MTTHTPSAITISVDGDGMMPAGRERQRIAGQVRLGQRQETAEAVVEDEHGVVAVDRDAAAPALDLVPQVPGPGQLDEATLVHAPPKRQQRSVEARQRREEQGEAAPRLGCVHQL